MEISLTPEQQSFLDSQVQSGRFASQQEAISVAVDLLEEQELADGLSGWNIEELRREIQLGRDSLDRGEGVVVTEANMEQFIEGIESRGRVRLGRINSHALTE